MRARGTRTHWCPGFYQLLHEAAVYKQRTASTNNSTVCYCSRTCVPLDSALSGELKATRHRYFHKRAWIAYTSTLLLVKYTRNTCSFDDCFQYLQYIHDNMHQSCWSGFWGWKKKPWFIFIEKSSWPSISCFFCFSNFIFSFYNDTHWQWPLNLCKG